MISIVAVGKKHDPLLAEAIIDYQKRLRHPYDLKWTFLPHSPADGPVARRTESRAIMALLQVSDFVLLLDERGKMFDSLDFSARLTALCESSRPTVIVIGGAFGVDDELRARADLVWSLSPLVFPHRLVRLLLAEQIYRAQSIATGQKYHHI